MLGPLKPRHLDESVTVSLEDLVPHGHFYRHREAKLDLGFVRDWVEGHYAARGRPSIDPMVFFKLQLEMFFKGICKGICSERKLIEMATLIWNRVPTLSSGNSWGAVTVIRQAVEKDGMGRITWVMAGPTE